MLLAACAAHIGVPVLVAQSVNQQAMMDLADQLLREVGIPSAGPSGVYLTDQGDAAPDGMWKSIQKNLDEFSLWD